MKHKGKRMFRLLFAASTLFLSTSLANDLNAQCDSPVGLQINEEVKDGEVVGIKVYGSDGTDGCDTGLSVCGDAEVKGLLAIEENAEVRFSGKKWAYSGKAKYEGKGAVRIVENTDCGTTETPEIEGDGDCDSPEKTFPNLIVETSKNVRFLGKTAVKRFEFAKGKALLDGDLCVTDVVGACAEKYFVTNSKEGETPGRLKTQFTSEVIMHVGSADKYAPIKFENSSGSVEEIAVRALAKTLEEGSTGSEMTNSGGTSWEVKGLSRAAQLTMTVAGSTAGSGTDFQTDRNYLARYIGVMENEVGGYKSDSKWDYTGYEGCGTIEDEVAIVKSCETGGTPSTEFYGKSRSFEDVEMSETELFSTLTCKPNCSNLAYFEGGKGYIVCFDDNDGINIAAGATNEVMINGKMEKYTRLKDKITNNEATFNCITLETTQIYSELTIFGCTTPVIVGQLPVELVSFNAVEEDCKVILTWETATEENNDFFEVQRSVDGRAYEAIGIVDGAGNTAEVQNYRFIDENPVAFAYYRLRQVDFDGTEDLTSIVRVNSSCFDRTVVTTLYPNPTNKKWVTLELASSGLGEIRVTITDLLGRQLQVNSHDLKDGINNVKLDISQMPAGTYFVHIYDNVSAIGNPVKLVKTQQQ